MGSIPGSERSPGGGNGNPLQCFCLENPMDSGAWQATVHGVTENRTQRLQEKKKILGPTPDLLDQNLDFQEILGLSAGMLKFKEHCSTICSPESFDYLLKQEC